MKDLTSTWKFLFATDSLSRYSILLPIQSKSITSDKLKDLILKAKDFICQGQLGDTNVTILHMDNWSVHQGLIDDETLKSAKINLEIKQRTSCSKNYLALIDGRIQKISPIIGNLSPKLGEIRRRKRRWTNDWVFYQMSRHEMNPNAT